jgi:hypothetical protein
VRMYVQLDVDWPENRKRIRAGLEGAGLHAICLCLAKRSPKDGWVARDTLAIYGADDSLIDRLIALDMLDADGEWVRPHDWLEVNLSSERIRAEKTDKARAANHARWQHPGAYESCEKCHKPRSSEADPNGVPAESQRIPGDPSTGSEPEEEPDPAPEDPPTLLEQVVDAVFAKVLADKAQRGERIASTKGFRSWWDENELEGCTARAAWILKHYEMPSVSHYADATRSPSVPRWAGSMLRQDGAA